MQNGNGTTERLLQLLDTFKSLNPDVVQHVQEEALALAAALGPASFPAIAAEAERIVQLYVRSPVKRQQRAVLGGYFDYLDRLSQRLIEAGHLEPDSTRPAPERSLALVPAQSYEETAWLKLKDRVEDDYLSLYTAVAAAQRRSEYVDSVLEPLFALLLRLDRQQALDWQLGLTHEGAVDPDIARDLCRVWQREPDLPGPVLERALRWSEDADTLRYWPVVTREADHLLRGQWLRHWAARQQPHTQVEHDLRYLGPNAERDRLRTWLLEAIGRMGDSIDFFCEQAEHFAKGTPAPWRQEALFDEIRRMQRILPHLFVMGDLLLDTPNGAHDFAMAIFGFTTDTRHRYQKVLEQRAQQIVHRWFLEDLRKGRKPGPTIHKLCFGDAVLEDNIRKDLDIVTDDFGDYKQRRQVVEKLAPMYASYREQPLLMREIGRRYRRTMRMLHEDNLHRVLSEAQRRELAAGSEVLLDLTTVAAASRRYLNTRGSLDQGLTEVMAADDAYAREIRRLRIRYLKRDLSFR